MVNEKDPEEIRRKIVHIAFTESEKKELKDFAKDSNMTISEFVRQAIFDKIAKIENHELFTPSGMLSQNDQFNEILDEIKTSNKQQKTMLEQLKILHSIEKRLEILRKIADTPNRKKNEQIIVKLLTEHGKLKPIKILELSNLKKEEMWETITNGNLFQITMNGDVELK